MTAERVLNLIGACASVAGFCITVWIVSKSSRIVAGVIGVSLLIAGTIIYVYLYTRVPRPVIPPLTISVDTITAVDTGDQISDPSPDQIIKVQVSGEHVKLHIAGRAEGVDLSRFKGQLCAYALVRPPTEKEIWYVQLRERGSVTESGQFSVEAYLGGIGPDSAREGQIFSVAIAILDFQPKATYDTLTRIPKDRPISTVYTLRVSRRSGP